MSPENSDRGLRRVLLARELELVRARAESDELRAELRRVEGSVSWRLFGLLRTGVYARVGRDSLPARGLQRGLRAAGALVSRHQADAIAPIEPIVFPQHSRPVASLVMAAHARPELLLASLRSIAANVTGVSYEVIVVDDAAGPATRAALSYVHNARVIQHETNLGYLESTNLGRGRRPRSLHSHDER